MLNFRSTTFSLISFLALVAPLYPDPAPQRIHIPLKTEKSVQTLHIAPLQKRDVDVSDRYIAETEAILKKALQLSGWYQNRPWKAQQPPSALTESFLADGDQNDLQAHLKECRKQWIHFYLSFSFFYKEKQLFLNATCLDARLLHSKGMKKLQSLPLSGEIDEDHLALLSLVDQINAFTVEAQPFLTSKIYFTVNRETVSQFSHHQSNSSDSAKQQATEIWESRIDGSRARCLCHEKALIVSPHHEAGCKSQESLFYVSYLSGQPKIHWAKLSDSCEFSARQVTSLQGNQLAPCYHRQHQKLLLINDSSGNPEIWIQSLSLQEEKAQKPQLFFEEKDATQATAIWRPDGKQVIFVSSMGGRPRIYSLDHPRKSDQKPRLLTRARGEATCPSISPDGKKLVYCVRQAGKGNARQLWIYDFATQEEAPLTTGPGNKENPSWACDSHHIVFNMDFGQKSALYMIDPAGRTPILLTNFSTDVRFPQCSH